MNSLVLKYIMYETLNFKDRIDKITISQCHFYQKWSMLQEKSHHRATSGSSVQPKNNGIIFGLWAGWLNKPYFNKKTFQARNTPKQLNPDQWFSTWHINSCICVFELLLQSAHLRAVTYITEISLHVTLNSKSHSLTHSFLNSYSEE